MAPAGDQGSGIEDSGIGFGLGVRSWKLGVEIWDLSLGFGIWDLGFKEWAPGDRTQDTVIKVTCSTTELGARAKGTRPISTSISIACGTSTPAGRTDAVEAWRRGIEQPLSALPAESRTGSGCRRCRPAATSTPDQDDDRGAGVVVRGVGRVGLECRS